MSVTNYNPSLSGGCKYSYDKLKKVVYLVSKDHVKDIHIDNGEAYISGLTEDPLRLNGFNIQLQEESSLDERYKFSKKVMLSLNGYVNVNFFGLRYYVIVESIDGTYWLVNVDFPSKVTYNFQLGNDINQTDFSFDSQSNYPTLKLNVTFDPFSPSCLGYNVNGIQTLKLLEKNYTAIDESNKVLYTYGKEFQDVKFLGNSCSLTESFDGERIQTQISFNIAFDDYKSSWQYNLLEFIENIYCAVILPKGGDNTFYVGYNFGLQPQYAIQSNSSDEGSDIITITLTETSNHGLTAESDYREEQASSTKWNFVEKVDKVPTYVCIGTGVGQYLVQQETDLNGNITGDYKALEGYEHEFPSLNIVGTFSDIQTFSKPTCEGEWDECHLSTNMPNTITYSAETCHTYSISGSCDWTIEELPSYLTALPSSGSAGTQYSVSLCNTLTPDSPVLTTFNIRYGNSIRVQPVTISNGDSYITPTSVTITYLAQNVVFNFNPNCPIQVIGADPSLTINIGYGTMTVTVPRNDTGSNRTFTITVRDCKGIETQVFIMQGYANYEWRDTSGYVCENGNSYVRQQKWVLIDGVWQPTDEYRAGSLIQSGDTRCSSAITKYEFDGGYYCVDGDKVECLEEFVSYDGGTTWTKTGLTRLGNTVETSSSFCNEPVTYSWQLTDKWQCGWEIPVIMDGGVQWYSTPWNFKVKVNGVDEDIQYNNNSWALYYNSTVTSLRQAFEGKPVTSVKMHNDIKLGSSLNLYGTFASCTRLEIVNLGSLLSSGVPVNNLFGTFEGCRALYSIPNINMLNTSTCTNMNVTFYGCSSLEILNLSGWNTSNVTSMAYMFEGCINLTTLDLSSFDFTNVQNRLEMFYNCTSLQTIYCSASNKSFIEARIAEAHLTQTIIYIIK